MLKLSYPQLGIGLSAQQAHGPGEMVQAAIPVVESVCHSARIITSTSSNLPYLGPLVPTLAHSMFLAAKVLVLSGSTLIQGSEGASRVHLLQGCLQVFAKRWRIAGRLLGFAPRSDSSRSC